MRILTLASGCPTWTFSAEGEIGAGQLARLDALLGAAGEPALEIVAIHHPPLSEGLNPLQRLRDSGALLDILAARRVRLVLHGHLHRAIRREITHAGHTLTLLGAASASSTGHHDEAASFNLIEVAPDGSAFAVRTLQPTPAIAASAST